MEDGIGVGDIVQLYCEGTPQDKYYLVIGISSDIYKEPPMYKLWSISAAEDVGWQYEFHTMGKLYRFKKLDRNEFVW